MVKYYGRARTRTGSVNTNQLGLKMSGCPSTVGKQGRIARYMGRRVDCMMGLCKPIRYHEVIWPRTRMRNQPPFCKAHATKCLAAAGGVGTNHNIPYYRIPAAGESGCTPAPVVTGGGFHLTVGEIDGPLITGYNAAGFGGGSSIIPGLPQIGALEPDTYKGRKIWALATAEDNGTPSTIGTGLTLSVEGSASVPFSTLLLSGGNIPGVYTFLAADAAVTPLPSGIEYTWCYPGGGTPITGTPCPVGGPIWANGDKVTVTIS